MKRAFLYGVGTFLIVGILGSLASFDVEAIVLALSLVPVSVLIIAAANQAPPNRSLWHAVLGWLLSPLAVAAGGSALIGTLMLAAWMRRAGLIAIDFWATISTLWLGLLLLALIAYIVRARGSRSARRAARETRRETDRRDNKAGRPQEAKKRTEWWEVLEVDRAASPDEIRRAYLRKLQMYHPDKFAGFAPEFIELSEGRTRELNLAFEEAKRSAVSKRG
jgi:cbb3-type cytochrome oxidase subunit 3